MSTTFAVHFAAPPPEDEVAEFVRDRAAVPSGEGEWVLERFGCRITYQAVESTESGLDPSVRAVLTVSTPATAPDDARLWAMSLIREAQGRLGGRIYDVAAHRYFASLQDFWEAATPLPAPQRRAAIARRRMRGYPVAVAAAVAAGLALRYALAGEATAAGSFAGITVLLTAAVVILRRR